MSDEFTIIFFVVLYFLAIAAMIGLGAIIWRWITTSRQGTPHQETALSVLESRFARGEIGAEELRERRAVLLEDQRNRSPR